MITYSRYRELIDRQLRIKDVRERVFQDNVIRPFLQELLPDYDIEPVDVKIRFVVHDYAQYCGTYLKGEKFVPATPDLCISDNWNWENRENHVIYRSVVEIKSPVLDPVTGFAPEQYKCLEEIERHLRAERTSGGRPLIDGIKWKEEKISEEGQGIGESDKLKKQLVQFIEESKEKKPLNFSGFKYDLSGNRTRVYAVRGRRLDRLTNRPFILFSVARCRLR